MESRTYENRVKKPRLLFLEFNEWTSFEASFKEDPVEDVEIGN